MDWELNVLHGLDSIFSMFIEIKDLLVVRMYAVRKLSV
jgi:hypothetical protein